MTMDIEEFEKAEREGDNSPTAVLVIDFLAANHDKAFRRKEIATAIGRNPNTVGTALSRLKGRGLVRHRKQHWALTDDRERLRNAIETSRSLQQLQDDAGPLIEDDEDAEAWADAQPDEPHPSDATELNVETVDDTGMDSNDNERERDDTDHVNVGKGVNRWFNDENESETDQ